MQFPVVQTNESLAVVIADIFTDKDIHWLEDFVQKSGCREQIRQINYRGFWRGDKFLAQCIRIFV